MSHNTDIIKQNKINATKSSIPQVNEMSMPLQSVSNTIAQEVAENYDYSLKSLPKILKPSHETNVPMKMDKKSSSLNRGSYHSYFINPSDTEKNVASENRDKYRELKKFMGSHHKTALINKYTNYRDVYNLSSNDRPQNNPLIS